MNTIYERMTVILLIFLITSLASTILTSNVNNKVKSSFNSELILTLEDPAINDTIPTRQRFRRDTTFAGSTYSEICGLSTINKPLILNGENVEPGEWPWLAAIFKRAEFGIKFTCAGSLVTPTHVITAAHCVQLPNRPLDQPRVLTIFLGKHNIFSFGGDEHSQYRKVSQILVHPQYNKPKVLNNDIAVLVLISQVHYSEVVKPVCLFSPQEPPNPIIGSRGSVIGWGKTETGVAVSEEPKLVRIPIVSQDVCVLSNPDFAHLISDKTFCAGSRDGSGPCNGDSGGGLFVSEQFSASGGNKKRWVLRGIVSSSLNKDGECDLSNYLIFTDVAKFSFWLKQVIPAQSFTASASNTKFPPGSSGQARPPPGCREYSRDPTRYVTAVTADASSVSHSVDKCDYKNGHLIVGEEVKVGEFPHMVALGYGDAPNYKFYCGGTLISENYVLFAARCTNISNYGDPKIARLGEHDLQSTQDGANPVDVEISQVTLHPGYRPPLKYHDIALLKLARRLQFNSHIRPACLPQESPDEDAKVVATGWGRVKFGEEVSPMLQKVVIPLVPKDKCTILWPLAVKATRNQLPRGIDHDTMICAGVEEGGRDVCSGFTGGPLTITNSRNACVHYVIGIISFGKLCGSPSDARIYTRVSYYVPWIESIVWPGQ